MPGTRSLGFLGDAALTVACSTVVFGPTFISGYCLHRVKCSPRKGMDRFWYFIYSYLVFAVPNVPLFYFGFFVAEEPTITVWYYAGVTVLLFGMLPLSPPHRRWRMYIPGVLGIILFYALIASVA